MVSPFVELDTMPSSREPWSNNFILTPDRSRVASISTPGTRDELAKALKEKIAADVESRPRNTSSRPSPRRPTTRPVSTRVTPQRTETMHWHRPATTGRRSPRDPPSSRHSLNSDFGAIDPKHTTYMKPPGAWLSPRAQPPPLPPGHRVVSLGADFQNTQVNQRQGKSSTRETNVYHSTFASVPRYEKKTPCSPFLVEAQLARSAARVATLERALRITETKSNGMTIPMKLLQVPVNPRMLKPSILEQKPKEFHPPVPASAQEKKPLLKSAPLLQSGVSSYGSGEASPKAGDVNTFFVDETRSNVPSITETEKPTESLTDKISHQHSNDVVLATATMDSAELVVNSSDLDLETQLVRALHASKRREFDAVTNERRAVGALQAAESRAKAAEERAVLEAKARRAAERDAAAAKARAAVFESRMEELRDGWGRLFGGGGVGVVTEPFSEASGPQETGPGTAPHSPSRKHVSETVDVETKQNDTDDDRFSVDIPPEFDVPTFKKPSSARRKTPGMSPRGGKQRGWAL